LGGADPGVYSHPDGWVKPALPFCWQTTLRREHPDIAGAVLMLFLIALGQRILGHEPGRIEPAWYVAAALALALLIGTRLIVLRTRWLHLPGR
jgi:hypothetical protein